jgi:single-strand DNA-binding protein
MSTHFVGEGNIGSAPDYREFPNGNDEPRRLLRLNVYFDNPIPKKDGEYEDRGGFWAPVELWHRDAEHWKTLYQKGMRVLVEGRTVRDEWEDADENERVETFKIEARRVGILPYRIESVALSAKRRDRRTVVQAPGRPGTGSRPPRAAVATVIRPPCTSELSPGDSSIRSSTEFQPPSRTRRLPARHTVAAARHAAAAPPFLADHKAVSAHRLPCCRHPLAPPC